MKFLKLSLAASVALGALSTASFAQPLEEAIKGVDVTGYLRYRYNDDRYDYGNNTPGGTAEHRWKAVADFKTPVVNAVSLNLGVLYDQEHQNVNHGKGAQLQTGEQQATDANGQPVVDANGQPVMEPTYATVPLGGGLGSGKDNSFGVSTFYAAITPDSTATTVLIGKQRLGTPLTNASDDDRGTGILALNSDIPGLTLAAGAFDSWALYDLFQGFNGNETSADLPLYVLAGIYGIDTGAGNFGVQLWGFNVQDLVDTAVFAELSWKWSFLNAKLQYLFTTLSDSATDLSAGFASDNDLAAIQVAADFSEFNIPLDIQVGYLANFQDGVTVSFDDEGAIAKAGKLWWQNNATGISFGLGRALNGATGGAAWNNVATPYGQEQEISVITGAIGYSFLDKRLRIGIEGVFGSNERTESLTGATTLKRDFTEITPVISWKHNSNLTISGFYAMLSTDYKEDAATLEALGVPSDSEDRNRARVEVRYNF